MRKVHSIPSTWAQKNHLHFRWFFLTIALLTVFFVFFIAQKEKSCAQIRAKLLYIEQEKMQALAVQQELLLQIQSQSDPYWVEMVLKKQLGMVRQGQTKIYFHNNS